MEKLSEFLSFSNISIVHVVLGCTIIGASSAVVGTFSFLKKKSLVGDAIAHAVLPGVCLAFIISQSRNSLFLILGAFLTGWLSLIVIEWIRNSSKLKEDTAIALTLSFSFGIGIMLLTYIQHQGNAAQAGLESFLFGKAAAMTEQDIWIFSGVAMVLILVVILLYKELKLILFDESFAQSIGLPVRFINLLLSTITVLAVVTGIQAVGVVLMAAMLITPAATSRFWTNDIYKMIWISALLGAFSGVAGAYISFIAPRMPTGPWIVMIISIIALISFFIAPRRGIIAKWLQQKNLQEGILEENVLKAFYLLSEGDKELKLSRKVEDLAMMRQFPKKRLESTLKKLQKQSLLINENEYWSFTEKGFKKGKRVVKLHRLWELYLSTYLKIAPDHVHEDAETMEHIITPEIEAKLERLLEYPNRDPHNSQIPY